MAQLTRTDYHFACRMLREYRSKVGNLTKTDYEFALGIKKEYLQQRKSTRGSANASL